MDVTDAGSHDDKMAIVITSRLHSYKTHSIDIDRTYFFSGREVIFFSK